MNRILISLLVISLTGCASVNYTPYTQEVYPPKLKDAPMVTSEYGLKNREYTVIGRLSIGGYSSRLVTTSQKDVQKEFFKAARQRGADGVINMYINSEQYQAYYHVPGQTSYQQVNTFSSGNVSGNVYGTYGNSARYSGTYSGLSTSSIPVHKPGYTVPYTGVVNSMSGDLICFLDKDSFGYLGIGVDMYAQNIDGIRISSVQEGGPANLSGMVSGDIITKINDTKISAISDWHNNSRLQVDQPIEITYLRGGQNHSVEVIPQRGNYYELE